MNKQFTIHFCTIHYMKTKSSTMFDFNVLQIYFKNWVGHLLSVVLTDKSILIELFFIFTWYKYFGKPVIRKG